MKVLPKHEERLGQYSTKASAKRHANLSNRRHKVVPSVCYRFISEEIIEYKCYTLQLQN